MLEMILLSFQSIYCNGSDGLENILQSKLRPLALWHLQRAVPAHCQHKKMHPGETCFSLPAHSSYFAAAAAKSLQLCPTLCDPIDVWQPTRFPRPWDTPGKNTGVGCHFLLQCMKVKSESEVAQLCPTLSDPMDCSLPGSSIHGIFQARVLEWGAIAFSKETPGITGKFGVWSTE